MKTRVFWIGSLVVLLLAAAVTITLAEETVTYYACVNNASGTIKIVEEDQECHKNETLISWNQRGPKGEQGEQGEPGPQGEQGEPGPQGEPGLDGRDGQDGTDGLACWDLDGDGAASQDEDLNGDGRVDVNDCQGPQGEQGPKGDQGDPGPQGEQGVPGPQGDPGLDGADGLACWDLNGDGVQDPEEDLNTDGSWDTLDCQGPEGPQGEQGDPGLTGPRGPEGPPGPAQAHPYTPYPGDLEIFFKIQGVNGSSQDSNHPDWSDALGYRFRAVMNPPDTGIGGSFGYLVFDNFQVIKPFDAATETITYNASHGTVMPKVELEVCRPVVSRTQECFLKVELQNVFIENYELVDVPSYGQLEVIGFAFDVISLTYTPYDSNGNACGFKNAVWDISTNTGNPPSAGVDTSCRVGYGDGDGRTYLDSQSLPGALIPSGLTLTNVSGLNAFNLNVVLHGGHTGGGTGTIENGVSLTKGSDQSSANWFYKLVSGGLVPGAHIYHCNHGSCPYRHEITDFVITEMTFSESQVEEIIIEPSQVDFETEPY